MSQPAKPPETKVPEPSIDEILASIRRSIVPDDGADKPAGQKAPSRKATGGKGRRADGEAAYTASDQTLGLVTPCRETDLETNLETDLETDLESAPDDSGQNAENGFASLNGDSRSAEFDPEQGNENDAPGRPAQANANGGSSGVKAIGQAAPAVPLLSPHATAAVDVAFSSLTHTVLSQNPRTLEDLVREMLKPMLKTWLDANLPDMVERLVRAEIERVSRRG